LESGGILWLLDGSAIERLRRLSGMICE